jgi:hypothetical protein
MNWRMGAVLLLVACKPKTTEGTFIADYAYGVCNKASICQWSELPADIDECVEIVTAGMEEFEAYCDDFQIGFARDCLSELRRMTCDQGAEYQDPDRHPGSCALVYECSYTESQ